jgi:rod shape determining protein RodA
MAALVISGVFFIKNAADYAGTPELVRNQLMWVGAGTLAFLVMAAVDYEIWLRLAPLIFIAAVLGLVVVLLFGVTINGATSWLRVGRWIVQPAEPAKLAFILGLSWLLLALADYVRRFWFFALLALAAGLPALLILKQPDLGTALVLGPITLVLMWAGGVPRRYLALPLAAVLAAVVFAYFIVYQAWWDGTKSDLLPAAKRAALTVADQPAALSAEEQAKMTPDGAKQRRAALAAQWKETGRSPYLVKPYQLDRVKSFIEPELDLLGAGWTINQSLNTIGSGGFKGKGYVSEYGFLPKNIAYNDFIFAVIGERVGFVGCALFIACQAALIIGVLTVGGRARDVGGMLICFGFAALLFAHFFENVGMTIKVTPITGIPLPFTSYGGSFLVTCMAGMGLVQSVWIHRKNY